MRPRPQSAAFIPLHTVTRLPPLNLRSTLPSYATLSSSTLLHTEPNSPPNAVFDFNPEKHLGVNRNLDHDQPEYPNLNPNDPNDHDKGKKIVDISDREWELRTGRAIYILRQTLPQFFKHGLISGSVDVGPSSSTSNFNLGHKAPMHESDANADDPESIYSPKIKLAYTPPLRLPPPFPGTLHVEGLPLYMASSVFIRHTLKTLYTDLHLEMKRVHVVGGGKSNLGSSPLGSGPDEETEKTGNKRDKSLFVGFCVRGKARVSGAENEWDVASTYTFSPANGLIHKHTINSIHPAPHQAAYDAIRSSLERILGLAGAGASGEVTRAEGGDTR